MSAAAVHNSGTSGGARPNGGARDHVNELEVGAARRFLGSILARDTELPPRLVETLLATSPARLLVLDPNPQRLLAAAMILAQARHGSADKAIALAEAETTPRQLEQDAQLPSETLARFWGAVAEAYAAAGLPRHTTKAARRAHAYAEDAGSEALLYWSLRLMVTGRALNGEFARAQEASSRAAMLAGARPWQDAPGGYSLALGQIILSSALADTTALAELAARLRGSGPGPTEEALAALAESAAGLADGRPGDGIAAIIAVTHGADAGSVPALLRSFLVGQHAAGLVARGEPRKALALLDGERSSQEHVVGLDLQRASALIRLGEDRQVLIATDHCIRLGQRHCLRTLAPVLLLRAAANERLGRQQAADAAFSDAFGLLHRAGAARPIVALPRDETVALVSRFEEGRRGLDSPGKEYLRTLLEAPVPQRAASSPLALTHREALIAHQLRGPGTLAQIASALFVSRNTVKSQTTSLYRKLKVTNRADAIERLERVGFYD